MSQPPISNRPLLQGIPVSSSSSSSATPNSNNNNDSQPVIVFPSAVVRNQDTANNWHSQILSFSDCLKDEETSWWGLWCCWILNARTIQLFGLGDSFREASYFWMALVMFFLLLIFTGPISYLFAIAVFGYFAYRRATLRTAIRQKLSIPGTFSDDLLMHGFCSCCTICQEAREAKSVNLPAIDWCYGEPLLAREEAHDYAVTVATSNSSSSSSGSTSSLLDCAPHFHSISKTSKFIVFLWALIALLTIFVDLILNESANVLVLLLIFVQPLLILYFVYWRARRQYAYLDYVIKTFAYGFW